MVYCEPDLFVKSLCISSFCCLQCVKVVSFIDGVHNGMNCQSCSDTSSSKFFQCSNTEMCDCLRGYRLYSLLLLCQMFSEEGGTIAVGAAGGKGGHLLSENGHPPTDTRGLSQNGGEETKACQDKEENETQEKIERNAQTTY